jgi:parallel beta-helix repeat protein
MITRGDKTVLVATLVAAMVFGSVVPGATLALAGSDTDDDRGGDPTEELRAVTTGTERSVLVPGERVAAVEPVTGCRVIDSPGRYELQADIVDGRALNCIDIRSSDVIFDGNGHTIDAVQLSNFVSSGIVARDGSNVTVKDVTVTEFKGSGVAFFSTDDTVVSDVRIRDGPLFVSNANATVRAVNVANPNEPDGSGVIVLGSTVTLRDVSATDNRFGFRFLRSGGHTLVNVSATDSSEVAFRFDDAGNNTLEDVSAVDSGGRGFEFVDSGGNTLLDVSVSDTSGEGLSFERSGDNTITDLSVERVDEVGVVFFNDSGGNTLTDLSTVETGFEGLLFADSGENTLTDVSVAGADRNGIGFIRIHAVDGSPNNTL